MKSLSVIVGLVSLSLCSFSHARSYVPIGSTAARSGAFLAVKTSDSPHLPGIRPIELELLEDMMRRKMPHAVGTDREKAHKSIIRNSLRNPIKQSHMIGNLAEAAFLNQNSKWGYVSSPNASQHDLYTWAPGRRTPFTAQIKTHVSGNPLIYADDMLRDHRSDLFVVPDDHVTPLREHWASQIRSEEALGHTANSLEARRQLARIKPLGATYGQLSASLTRGARAAQREQYAGYVSLGTATAIALGPQIWEALNSQSVNAQTVVGAAHAGSVIAAERTTTYILSRNSSLIPTNGASGTARLGSSIVKGSIKGNVITGTILFGVDTAFSVYEFGGARAFQTAAFYTNMGGSLSAAPLGLAAGSAAISVTGNPYAGVATGMVVGTAAYVGGREATRRVLEAAGPAFLHKEEDAALGGELIRVRTKLRASLSNRAT